MLSRLGYRRVYYKLVTAQKLWKAMLCIVLPSVLFWEGADAQTCLHTTLSNVYDFKVTVRRAGAKGVNSPVINLEVISKAKESNVQKIQAGSTYLFSDEYSSCNFVRSYSTGVNQTREVVDNDFGDLVVADLNFDNREDLALKRESGGNGGPLYNFYVQSTDGKFVLDTFLTAHMQFFPTRIDKTNRALITLVHASAYSVGEHTYKLGVKNKQWKEVKHRFIPAR
jgi:hypothetical protein